jgi:murein DD-endopeptidase MepM/ murein hydrolase activator NlpD
MDLPVPVGTPVHVIRGGKVISAGSAGRCGLGVVVQARDGGRYVYCHLSRIAVPVGAGVTTGSVLGLSGNTGHSTGPHLHVGVSSPTGTARCPQSLLLAVFDGAPVPAPSALRTSGCFYSSPPSPSQGIPFSAS